MRVQYVVHAYKPNTRYQTYVNNTQGGAFLFKIIVFVIGIGIVIQSEFLFVTFRKSGGLNQRCLRLTYYFDFGLGLGLGLGICGIGIVYIIVIGVAIVIVFVMLL